MLGLIFLIILAVVIDEKLFASAWAGIILFAFVGIALLRWQAKREAQKAPVWRGRMSCITCRYEWTSRRQTPPATCPACRSGSIRHRLE